MNFKNVKGITLIALIVTITVILIIAGITIYKGSEIIIEAKKEDVKTNMLLVQAEIKNYAEQAKFEKKDTINGITVDGLTLSISEPNADGFCRINTSMSDLGLGTIDPNKYLIAADIGRVSVDVYFVPGIEDSDGNTYHQLSEMQE